jgi:hypothetical protein
MLESVDSVGTSEWARCSCYQSWEGWPLRELTVECAGPVLQALVSAEPDMPDVFLVWALVECHWHFVGYLNKGGAGRSPPFPSSPLPPKSWLLRVALRHNGITHNLNWDSAGLLSHQAIQWHGGGCCHYIPTWVSTILVSVCINEVSKVNMMDWSVFYSSL